MTGANVFPLTLAAEGERVKVVALRTGRHATERLRGMGLAVNSVLEVIARQPGGAMLIGHGPTRLALGAGMASRIAVVRFAEAADGR